MNANYTEILQDVVRYGYVHSHGFWDGPTERPVLAPAAEEALRELCCRVVADIGVPHLVARRGLVYALQMQPHPLESSLIGLAYQLRLAKGEWIPARPVEQPATVNAGLQLHADQFAYLAENRIRR